MYQGPMRRGPQTPSYDSAFRNTFKTTYDKAYQGVDTVHLSPVYTERGFHNQSPPYHPYPNDYQQHSPRHMEQVERHRPGPMEPPRPHRYYDYNDGHQFQNRSPPQTERLARPDRPTHSEYVKRRQYNEMLAHPEERNAGPVGQNACVYCRGPEMHVPKCTNQLGCLHKFCDNCVRLLHAVDGPFRDRTALYYYCALCRNNRTPAPKIVRFDPYGRRILKFSDVDNYHVDDEKTFE